MEENKLIALVDKNSVVYYVLETERNKFLDREATIEDIERKQSIDSKEKQIDILKQKLKDYSEDIVQDLAGEVVPNIEDRKLEFMRTHDMLRLLLGKSVRTKKNDGNINI